MTDPRVPVTLLTGFLGSGKTTLLNAILADGVAGRVAVIVNEFGDAGLDHDLIEESSDEIVLMQSGCLCCSVRGDLPRTILRLLDRRGAGDLAFYASGTPRGAECDRLVDDVAAPADIFTNLLRAKWLRLRLDIVTNNACRRFHIDAVTARLVCTYRGTGTQYGIATNGAEPHRVFTAPKGAPILFRGALWPERPKSGLLHRSPPIEGTGETRLVLVPDPVLDPEEEI